MKRVVSGIIMELTEYNAVVMTGDGEFLKVKKPSPDIELGEEITSTVITNNYNMFKYASIAAAIIILLMPFVYFNQALATVAYVNVDINPSLELGINKYNKVNSVTALNNDAESLIKNMPLKDLDINEALGKVINQAKDMGYINDNKQNNIEIALVKIKDSEVKITQESLAEYVKTLESKVNMDATVKIQDADKKIYEEAKKENISPNKYLDNMDKKDEDTIKVKINKFDSSIEKDNKSKENIKENKPEDKKNENEKKDKESNLNKQSQKEADSKNDKLNQSKTQKDEKKDKSTDKK